MNQLTIFRVLTFILLPIAVMFGLMDIILLVGALGNPAFLLIVFILAAFVIYTFASLQFLAKSIDTGKPSRPSLRDWIRVNAFVSTFMGIMFLMNALSVFFTDEATLRQYLTRVLETQVNVPPMLNIELFIRIMKMAAYFMCFLSIVLLVHIFLNFRIMKKYRHLFGQPVA